MRVWRFAIREDTLFLYCRLWKWVGGMWELCDTKLTLRKRHFFLIEKYIENARQDEKHVPDMLESIMKPTDPVKEELWRKTTKMHQCVMKNTKSRVCTFWMSGNLMVSRKGQNSVRVY